MIISRLIDLHQNKEEIAMVEITINLTNLEDTAEETREVLEIRILIEMGMTEEMEDAVNEFLFTEKKALVEYTAVKRGITGKDDIDENAY